MSTPLRILLVEDSPSDAQILQDVMGETNPGAFAFTRCERLAQGLEHVRQAHYDAMLLDLSLPDSFGSATFIRARAEAQHIPIVVLTGAGDEALGLDAVRHGVQGYLMKDQTDGKSIARTIRYAIERKQMEEALIKAKEELEQRVQERTAQIRMLALALAQAERRERKRLAEVIHDHLQQLLVGAKMRLVAAQKQAASKTLRQSIERTADLLDEAIVTAKSLTMELSPPILHEGGLVAALNWLARWMGSKHGLTVSVSAEEEIDADPDGVCVLLFQCVRELLFNVVKHSGETSAQVSVARIPDGMLRIMVSDRGAGFDASKVEALDEAAGFGLFSIRERLNLLGGQFSVESAPHSGARITMTAPLAAPAPPKAPLSATRNDTPLEPESKAPATAPGKRKVRVMLADDHEIVREGLRRLLEAETDIEVIGEADNGVGAVAMARRLLPDILILDVALPRMNGIEATRRIVTEAPGVRVIGLSMYEEADQASAMMEAGAVAYLYKAGPSENLIAAIKTHCPPP